MLIDKEAIKNRTLDEKKVIRIYTIELAVFSVVFLTLGILMLVGVLGNNSNFRLVFTYITLVGAALLVGDFLWAIFSPKRRKKVSLFDKILVLPAPITIVTLDIITLIKGVEEANDLHRLLVGIVFCYIAAVYLIQAVYHYFKPLPDLLEAARAEEEEENEEEPKEDAESVEETPKPEEEVEAKDDSAKPE